jgi:hypothetical protein
MVELCGVHIPETESDVIQSGWRSLDALVASAPLSNCHLERDPRNLQAGLPCRATVHENGAAATYCDSDHHARADIGRTCQTGAALPNSFFEHTM